jgi:bla regulator protein blaR1
MIENSLTSLWNSVAPAVANHLWQSTLVVLAAGLLTLVLGKHHAGVRFWLWLAASLKFLVPFSLLVAIGRYLAWSHPPAKSASLGLFSAIGEITQPFALPAFPVPHHAANTVSSSTWANLFPVLLVLWLLGFAAVLLVWAARWRRIAAAMNSAMLLCEGREIWALRRLERLGGIRKPISVLLASTSLEPGIVGIAHPALLWPEGISHSLEDSHLEAILAHEVWHVRRRDNLSAALHMLVEAVFWFYPLVWWLGTRLVEERERACDQEAVALGGDRQIYAESILKVCEFCLEAPLPCVSGVTGADLKKRMVHIMNDHIVHKLGLTRKLLLMTAATLAIAIPVSIGLLTATPIQAQSQVATSNLSAPVFSSVSIRPDESTANQLNRFKIMFSLKDGTFVAKGATLKRLIQMAYRVQDSQISGGPEWLDTAKFDIEAKLEPSFVFVMHQPIAEKQTSEDRDRKPINDQAMLQSLLADKFGLSLHPQTQNLPVYDLVVDENGHKLQPSDSLRFVRLGRGELTSQGTPLDILAFELSARLGRVVVDKTGLKGTYAYSLHWTPDPGEDARLTAAGQPGPVAEASSPDPNGPSLFAALQEQLGLKLEPNTEPVQVLVIDHAEQPSQN